MNKSVWYLSKYAVTPYNGKPGNRSFELMKELSTLGYNVTIITSDANHFSYEPSFSGRINIKDYDSLKVLWLKTLKYRKAFSIRRILGWFHFEWRILMLNKNNLPKPDVIIVSSLSLLTILNGIFLRNKYRSKLIFEIRDIWPLTLTEEGGFSRWNPLVFILSIIEKLGYAKSDYIVGTMPNLGEHVTKVLGYTKPTFCIPMGLEKDFENRSRSVSIDFKNRYIDSNQFTVAYAGSIGISNALDQLFEVASSLLNVKSIRFLIIGDGYLKDFYADKYKNLENVIFTGKIPKEEIISALQSCDLLYFAVHPSKVWDYGLSLNKMIDYMLAAKPIIASYSGFPSMVNEANCGSFVPSGDMVALQKELLKYFNMSYTDREVLGANGKSWLIANRMYSHLAKNYVKIFS